MSIFWMGVAPVAVILIGFILILGVTRGVAYVTEGGKKESIPSSWVTRQVYSGDDTLGHPDLKKMADLKDEKTQE